MSEWEERMGARAEVRRRAKEAASVAESLAKEEARLAEQRAEVEAGPPGGCYECYEVRPHPSFGTWRWWHVWPADQPFEDWICRHECHGPDGAEQHAVAYG